MPTNKLLTATYLTTSERAKLAREAKREGLSLANLIRIRLGLPRLAAGPPKGNRNAARKA